MKFYVCVFLFLFTFAPAMHSQHKTRRSATLSGLSCTSSSFSGAGTDSCKITLNAAAPSGGVAVSLASNNGSVIVPSSIMVPAGSTTASFTATVKSVSTTQTATLTASYNGVLNSFAIQLNALTPTLSVNAMSIAFGTVNVNSVSTQTLTLTSTGTAAVTISSVSIAGTGFTFSGAALPLTLNPNQSATLNVMFDPTSTGAMSGQMTISSNSSAGSQTVIGLSGTGQSISHEVDLNWNAPASSPVPVAGYVVYRSSSGSAYQQINSAAITSTTFADSAIQSGQTYTYMVESVDSYGNTSVASNTVNLSIP